MTRSKSFPIERPSRIEEVHRDYPILAKLEEAIYRQARGKTNFQRGIPKLLRQSIDEVIDARRSGRFLIDQLESTEKTYIGTKIEILLRNHLQLQRGVLLDVLIDGVEVDIKNTIHRGWMIPKEAIGHPCILIRTDERKARCWFGLVVIHADMLRTGENRDTKSSISADNFRHILWLLYDHEYPINFWELVTGPDREFLMAPRSGNERVVRLFKLYNRVPISREILLSLAPQDDTMRRLRKNGGARDKLGREGIALLSGKYDGESIRALGLSTCGPSDFISVKPMNNEELAILKISGHLV